jgi:hypothetical protein
MSVNPEDWKMAERIAENSNTYKSPQEVLNAFEAFMKQVEKEQEEGKNENQD